MLHRALDDQFFSVPDQTASQEAQVATLARRVQELDARMLAAFEMIEEDPSDELAKSRYRALKAQHSEASNQLSKAQAELSEARGSVSPGEHLARVAEVRSLMDANDPATRDEARARVKLALNGLIERCVFASATSSASLCLVGDLGLLIVRKSGGVSWFDFAKPGRDYGHLPVQERALVSAYLSRRAA